MNTSSWNFLHFIKISHNLIMFCGSAFLIELLHLQQGIGFWQEKNSVWNNFENWLSGLYNFPYFHFKKISPIWSDVFRSEVIRGRFVVFRVYITVVCKAVFCQSIIVFQKRHSWIHPPTQPCKTINRNALASSKLTSILLVYYRLTKTLIESRTKKDISFKWDLSML